MLARVERKLDKRSRAIISRILGDSGIVLDGPNSWDMQIRDESVLERIIVGGSLALGEGYMARDWDVEDLAEFTRRALIAGIDRRLYGLRLADMAHILRCALLNRQWTYAGAAKVTDIHYDLGNDFFELILGELMVYTCGYWKDAQSLDQAQKAKLDLVARKLMLTEGDRVLDIGCGWGHSLVYLAQHYGIRGVGVTNSKEQASYARDYIQKAGLDHCITIECCDFRQIQGDGSYDAIYSLGMFEHVGPGNYDRYMRVVDKLLKLEGLFLLHTICAAETQLTQDSWFGKYIFPNSHLPSVAQIMKASDKVFVFKDGHNFGADYALTLNTWHQNLVRAWPKLVDKYGDRFNGEFFRAFKYFLLQSAGGFESGYLQLCQFVYSKRGQHVGYVSVR